MKNNIFSLIRFYYLLRRQIFSNFKKNALGFGSIVGVLLAITLLTGMGNPVYHISALFPLYVVIFLIGGYIYTSSIFAELSSVQRGVTALTLPVSKLERLAAAWVLTALLYPIMAMLGVLLISLLTGLAHGFETTSNIASVLFSKSTFNLIVIYIITKSIFLFGAIYFRKNNFFKTIGSVILIQLVLLIIVLVAAILMFGGMGANIVVDNMSISSSTDKFLPTTIIEIIGYGLRFLFAPFFWLLTWFGIKEREV